MDKRIDLSRPQVMGILNVTPDSFSDGGRYTRLDAALRQAGSMAAEGAAMVDVGGESTRPGAQAVSVDEELDRVIPVIEAIAAEVDVLISVDTNKAAVMREAVNAGAVLINDVRALREEGALPAAAESGAAVCLMHMQGQPRTMQKHPEYEDVVADIKAFLNDRLAQCERRGIDRSRLLVDPGFGFGKTLPHNLTLLKRLSEFSELGVPVLTGLSRKSMIGAILENGGRPAPVEERLHASVAAAQLCVLGGARVLRVHDVAPTVAMLRVMAAVDVAAGH